MSKDFSRLFSPPQTIRILGHFNGGKVSNKDSNNAFCLWSSEALTQNPCETCSLSRSLNLCLLLGMLLNIQVSD